MERMAGFFRGLGEAGFTEGRNVAIEYRWADGQFDRLPGMAADLVGRKVTVLFATAGDVGIRAAIAATKTIPIVFGTASDPVAAGFVASLNRPGGNVTGVTQLGQELGPKRLELLHELLPTTTRIALLVNPSNPTNAENVIQVTEASARHLGLETVVLRAGSDDEIERAIARAVQQRAGALNVGADAYLSSRERQIAFFALRHGLPTMANARESVAAGILMGYGPSRADFSRQQGIYVGRILKGEKPADLPVLQPTKFELTVNLTTAKALGLTVPATLLATADEVIE
jgi:putative ABC transport system substrate-binding protein